MPHYRTTPTYEQPLSSDDNTTNVWWRWFQDIDNGVPPSGEINVKSVASPFIYSAKSKGNIIVNGGTVTAIAISRTGTFYTTGAITGMFNLCANDQIRVTYSSPPTLTFFPT